MSELYKITVWNGTRLVAVAENIVACGEKDAHDRGIKALASRAPVNPYVKALYYEQFEPWNKSPFVCDTDGLRVLVHPEPPGVVVG